MHIRSRIAFYLFSKTCRTISRRFVYSLTSPNFIHRLCLWPFGDHVAVLCLHIWKLYVSISETTSASFSADSFCETSGGISVGFLSPRLFVLDQEVGGKEVKDRGELEIQVDQKEVGLGAKSSFGDGGGEIISLNIDLQGLVRTIRDARSRRWVFTRAVMNQKQK